MTALPNNISGKHGRPSLGLWAARFSTLRSIGGRRSTCTAVACSLAALLLVAGCQSGGAGAKADVADAPAAAPSDSAALATAEQEAHVRAEMAKTSADAEFQAAVDLLSAQRYDDAERSLLKVLELDPTHADAQSKLAQVRRTLGKDPAGPRAAFEMLSDIEQVKQQQIAIEVAARITRGHAAFDTGEFEKAESEFANAIEIIRFQPFYHDLKGQRDEASDMLERSRVAKREATLNREEAIQREVSQARRTEEATRQQRDADRIRQLFQDGNKRFHDGSYLYARKIFDEILRLDPTNADARRLRDTAQDAYNTNLRNENLKNILEEWRTTFEEHRRAEIFQADTLVWPSEEDWRNTAARKPRRASSVEETSSPEDAAVWSRLRSSTVNIDFQETPLEQVRTYLQEVSGVSMIIDPAVWEAVGEDVSVTINLSDMKLDSALNIMMDLQNLAYRVENGVLMISTPQQASGQPILSLYDVRDLTGPLQDFPGPNIELANDDDSGGSFGISIAGDEPTGTISEDELVDLVKGNVNPESWEEEGRTIEIRNRTLIVRTTSEVHREVEHLLSDLRQSGGILVTVESRFLTVEDNFLESMGIDWRGLGDERIGPPSVPTGTTAANYDDFLVGIPNAPTPYQSIGQDRTSGLFFDDGMDGDLRARVENLFDGVLGDSRVLTESGGLSLQWAILDDAQLEFIVRAVRKNERVTLLTAPSITTFNTQRAHVLVVNQIAYIRDYDVEVAQRAAIADPIIGTIQDGLVLDVRPIVSSDRRYVTMELRPTIAELHRPIETFETTLATGSVFSASTLVQIQIPELTLQKVRTTATVPDGGTIMIGGLKTSMSQSKTSSLPILRNVPGSSFIFGKKGEANQRKNLVILIKASITSLSEQEPKTRQNAY